MRMFGLHWFFWAFFRLGWFRIKYPCLRHFFQFFLSTHCSWLLMLCHQAAKSTHALGWRYHCDNIPYEQRMSFRRLKYYLANPFSTLKNHFFLKLKIIRFRIAMGTCLSKRNRKAECKQGIVAHSQARERIILVDTPSHSGLQSDEWSLSCAAFWYVWAPSHGMRIKWMKKIYFVKKEFYLLFCFLF